jgi:transcriptional regulator GlxA family with amidase domain
MPSPHRVAVLALDGVVALDLAIATHLFAVSAELSYAVSVCGAVRGQVRTASGFPVVATSGLTAVRRADTVVVPGFAPHGAAVPREVIDALQSVAAGGARVMSICTGAFALAAAGLLDGLRATTHWMHTAELAERYPQVMVEPGVLYVDEGQVLTSAGVASGIDLCLHVIRRDHGARAAAAVARRVVVAPHRDGGQAQYIEAPVTDDASSLSATRDWALARIAEPVSVRQLAQHACVSERTLARRWLAETGTSPLRWLSSQRILAARELLEAGAAGLDEVARRCGLGGADNLRLRFLKEVGTTPSAYRRAFAR